MFLKDGIALDPASEFEWSHDGSGDPETMVKTRCMDATADQLKAGGIVIQADPAPTPTPGEPARIRVRKSLIIDRLNATGKLQAANVALNADLYTRERWYAPDVPFVYADAPEAVELVKAIGADPAIILAAE